MKPLRIGPAGAETPCVIGPDGAVHDASGVVDDWSGPNLDPEFLDRLSHHVRLPY